MTSEELIELRDAMPFVSNLFADGNGNDIPAAWSDPFANESGSRLINWDEGIPPDYAMPYNNGGKKVLRTDVNAVGNIASRELYLLQHGGYHTFDGRVAEAIGGYPYGAFLDWYQESTGWMRKVRCVKEGGNCFTPIDDPDNGVESSDPHWVIADAYVSADNDDSNPVTTTPAPIPPGGAGGAFWGGYCLEIQRGTVVSANETVKSETWVAPFDALVSIPFIRSGLATMYDNTEVYVFMPYMYSTASLYDLEWYLEVTDADSDSDHLDIRLFQNVPTFTALEDSGFRDSINALYTLIPRMYVKKGTRLRFCCKNTGNSDATLSCAYLKFDLSEVT